MSAVARRVSFGMSGTQKYRNKPTEVDGIRFDSKREANRYRQLLLLEKSGEVKNIIRQLRYKLEFAGTLICTYQADFVYTERQRDGTWLSVVEDVKGVRTPVYRLKRKMMKALLGIEIRET